ncbi:hypothetical protein HK405_008844, partial [Cladochytrium tenue]
VALWHRARHVRRGADDHVPAQLRAGARRRAARVCTGRPRAGAAVGRPRRRGRRSQGRL